MGLRRRFVHDGDPTEIKVDAFNFTKYGLLHGQVISVSQDAIIRDKGPANKSDAPTRFDVTGQGIMTSQMIRRIRSDEWRELRAFRLRSLAEAPMAYGSTLAQEEAYSEDVWRERSFGPAAGCDRATFIAEREGAWIGTVTGLADHDGQRNAGPLLVAMFVVSSARRQGIGVGLVEAVSTWARNCGARQLTLWVTSGNNPAVALYQRCGFRFTGVTKPLAHTPALTEHEMVRHCGKL